MCGIFGIVCKQDKLIGPTLIEAGLRLSYRGYDSVGVATIDENGKIDLRKDAGKVTTVADKFNFKEMNGQRGILQLRWATFGEPSMINAQPHLDSEGLMVGAHNGNVVNNSELREEFIAEGMLVRSTNDGESCVHAVERYINLGYSLVDSIRKAYEILKGDYAFVIGQAHDDKLYAFKKGSGLIAGIEHDFTVVSSDLPSILPLTKNIVFMNDGEIIELTSQSFTIYSVSDGSVIERTPEIVEETMEAAQKGGFDHFMLKEIHEQPIVAKELLHLWNDSSAIEATVEALKKARNIYFVGCGTSYNACVAGAVYFNRICGKTIIPIVAPQFIAQYNRSIGREDVGIFVSQSGETKDVLNAVTIARQQGMRIFSLVNVVGSTLTKWSEQWLPLACGYEISVPATKTFTNQLVGFLYLALKFSNRNTNELDQLPEFMQRTIQDTVNQVTEILPHLLGWNDLYSLGYGLTYPIAMEAALKLKEITYSHCEGMLSTEFKHGPLAAVTKDYPIIFSTVREDIPIMISGINEVTCRGARAIVVGPDDERLKSNAQHTIIIPETTPEITSILAIVPLQLLAYHLSVEKGFDPDFPRNLSKTLTVD